MRQRSAPDQRQSGTADVLDLDELRRQWAALERSVRRHPAGLERPVMRGPEALRRFVTKSHKPAERRVGP